MPSHEDFKRIEPISGSEPTKVQFSTEATEGEGPSKVKFDDAVARADPSKVERRDIAAAQEPAIAEAKKPSLMEIATRVTVEPAKVTPTPKTLADQAADLRRQMERPRAVLMDEIQSRPAVVENLKPSDIDSLSGHIEHVDRGLRDVSQLTTGVEIGSLVPKEKSPAVKFLSFLTESDKKLGNFVDELKGLKMGQQRLTPETLFAIQVKLGFIQTELEFFTATLNKALESTKTLMNVQI
jgi:hypothetical protein